MIKMHFNHSSKYPRILQNTLLQNDAINKIKKKSCGYLLGIETLAGRSGANVWA